MAELTPALVSLSLRLEQKSFSFFSHTRCLTYLPGVKVAGFRCIPKTPYLYLTLPTPCANISRVPTIRVVGKFQKKKAEEKRKKNTLEVGVGRLHLMSYLPRVAFEVCMYAVRSLFAPLSAPFSAPFIVSSLLWLCEGEIISLTEHHFKVYGHYHGQELVSASVGSAIEGRQGQELLNLFLSMVREC